MKQTIEKLNKTLNWGKLSQLAKVVVDTAINIQQIPAPTFEEEARATYILEQFQQIGLVDVEMDGYFNVYGRLPGRDASRRAVMVSAHSDTVFKQSVDLSIRKEGDLVYGPGLGDNSIAIAGVIGFAKWVRDEDIIPESDIWIVSTTREEGLGDLGGMRAAYHRLKSKIWCVINVEGLAFGHVYHAGIAVRRLHITATASGGHSWLHFGRDSALHGIVQLGAQITEIRPPENPRTTYNIGMVNGGQSINSIASSAELWLDMRSEELSALQGLEKQVLAIISTLKTNDLHFDVKVVGDRPSGYLSSDHKLVQGSLAVLQVIGVRGHLQTGSTDANIPLSDECPAVTIGITQGGNAHRLDEYIEVKPVQAGLKQLIIFALASARERDTE
ncbi:MAG: M20/M25/M40 family metallo-hydrolase [Aggregatilineales bacterium]